MFARFDRLVARMAEQSAAASEGEVAADVVSALTELLHSYQGDSEAEPPKEDAVDGEDTQAVVLKIAQQPADAQVAADPRCDEADGQSR